jgi:small subunit ribosomal protein S1
MQTNNSPLSFHDEGDEASIVFEVGDHLTFESLLSQESKTQNSDDDRVVRGTVLPYCDSRYLFVDIGGKFDAVLPRAEAEDLQPGEEAVFLSVGSAGDTNEHDLTGLLLSQTALSSYLAEQQAWKEVQALLQSGETCEVTVIDSVYRQKDKKVIGLLVLFRETLTGFLPARCLADKPKNFELLQGETFSVVVTKAEDNGRRRDIRFSSLGFSGDRNSAVGCSQTSAALAELVEGETAIGVVTNFVYTRSKEVKPNVARRAFGALVRLHSGVEGMIHKADLAKDRHFQIEDLISLGQEIQVKIGKVDLVKQRVSLSFADTSLLKQQMEACISRKLAGLSVGDEVDGHVLRFVYERMAQGGRDKLVVGVVVALQSGAEAFLHRSDCMEGNYSFITRLFQLGEKIRVSVSKVDAATGRVEVSFKDLPVNRNRLLQMQQNACEELIRSIDLAVGKTYKGVVSNKLEYGAFVKLAEEVEALLHISDIEPEKELQSAALKKLPRELSVKVSNVEVRNGRLRVAVVRA